MTHPALRVGALGRAGQEGAQVLGCLLRIAPLEQEKRDAIMGSTEAVVQLQCPLVVADGFFRLAGLGEPSLSIPGRRPKSLLSTSTASSASRSSTISAR